MQTRTKPNDLQSQLAEIGFYYPTAILWVSKGRYTYCTGDSKYTGHCTEPDERKFRRALSLEVHCLVRKGYYVSIKNTTIEG